MGLQLVPKHLSILLVVTLFSEVQCYKILVYNPKLGHSHVNFFGRIADILVEAGYEVVTYIPEMDPDIKTNGTKLSRVIPGPHLNDAFSMGNITRTTWTEDMEDFVTMFEVYNYFSALQVKSCSIQVGNEASMEQLRAEEFDFGITELISPCGFAIFRKIGLKNYAAAFATDIINVISDPLGVSSNPSFVPSLYSTTGDIMNYWERMQNLVAYIKTIVVNDCLKKIVMDEKVTKYLPEGYGLEEMVRKSSLAFVNSEELIEFPRLISHKIVFVGGIAVNKPKPLNEITFIWKYEEDDDYAADLPNVIKKKWIPQLDLLGHPALRAFVSHCGQNSLEESVHQAVPLICIPLFGDQTHNARVAERRNIGIYIDKYNLSPKALKDAFRKILYDTRYREASKRLQEMIRNKPTPSRERFLRYIDFALKFGPIDSFDIAANNLSFIQYYLLDIIIPILLVFALIAYLIFRLVLRVIRKLLFLSKLKSE